MEGNHVYVMPRRSLSRLSLGASAESSRRFLVSRATDECAFVPRRECVWTLPVEVEESGGEFVATVISDG